MEQKEEVERWPQLKKKKRRSLSVERLRGLFSFKSSPKAKAKAKAKAQKIKCASNLKNVGLGFRIFATDNGGPLPHGSARCAGWFCQRS